MDRFQLMEYSRKFYISSEFSQKDIPFIQEGRDVFKRLAELAATPEYKELMKGYSLRFNSILLDLEKESG
jgi:hypothetical protein